MRKGYAEKARKSAEARALIRYYAKQLKGWHNSKDLKRLSTRIVELVRTIPEGY